MIQWRFWSLFSDRHSWTLIVNGPYRKVQNSPDFLLPVVVVVVVVVLFPVKVAVVALAVFDHI